MAVCVKGTAKVPTTIIKDEPRFVLTLTRDEANTLVDVAARCGGFGRRLHMNAIATALGGCGLAYSHIRSFDLDGFLSFD